jgi:hypothetical protein
MVKPLCQILVINSSIPHCAIVDMRDISELKYENFTLPGVFLFFDGKCNLYSFGCSYNDILTLALENSKYSNIYGYYIIKDPKNKCTEEQIDDIYDSIASGGIHMHIVGKEIQIPLYIGLN